jgi:hypothetical protein
MDTTLAKSKRQVSLAMRKIISAAREYASAEKALEDALRAEQAGPPDDQYHQDGRTAR